MNKTAVLGGTKMPKLVNSIDIRRSAEDVFDYNSDLQNELGGTRTSSPSSDSLVGSGHLDTVRERRPVTGRRVSEDSESAGDENARACVIFDTRYGNTERVARSFEAGLQQAGLQQAGLQTVCVNVKDAAVDSLKQYDLICVGAPTEAFSASKPMKEFLGKLKSVDLSGKYGFAFDTKLDWRLSGSAAKFIEKELNNLGLQIVAPRESAIVLSLKERGAITGARLKEGEEERFEKIGTQVGTALAAATGRMVQA